MHMARDAHKAKRLRTAWLLLTGAMLLLTACGRVSPAAQPVTASSSTPTGDAPTTSASKPAGGGVAPFSDVQATPPQAAAPVPAEAAPQTAARTTESTPSPAATGSSQAQPGAAGNGSGVKIAAQPDSITVLIDKRTELPPGYQPPDLVEPNVPFIFSGYDEKRLMRKEAARLLEQMFAAAKKDGIYLAGVSGYRSYATQKALFDYYVRTQGSDQAHMYSAEPGHSEHQTGLAMDVSGTSGRCAADDCFADTPEAKWLAQHAAVYGFIIRYPKGKERVTGYAYEPWHVRYVGTALSAKIAALGITLDEYFGGAA